MNSISPEIFVYPNRALVNEATKHDSDVAATIGAKRTTAIDLVMSEWELWGDGRKVADDAYRLMNVYGMLQGHGLETSMGAAAQVSSFIYRHLSYLESMGFAAEGLSEKEAAVLEVAKEYSVALEVDGRIEVSQVLAEIGESLLGKNIAFVGDVILEEPLQSFFAHAYVRRLPLSAGKLNNAGLKVLKAEGPSVVPRMMIDEVDSILDSARAGSCSVAIVAKDPKSRYSALSPYLFDRGFDCSFKGTEKFSEIEFGRFFLSICKLLSMAGVFGGDVVFDSIDDSWIDVATDIANSPYAGIAQFEASVLPSWSASSPNSRMSASDLNTHWRSDRTLGAVQGISDLAKVSSGFARIQVVFTGEGNPFAAIGNFEDVAKKRFDGPRRIAEVEAVKSLLSLMDLLADRRKPVSYLPMFAEAIRIPVSFMQHCDEGRKKSGIVAFHDIPSAQDIYPGSFDAVILDDVTDEVLNAKTQKNTVDIIAAELGMGSEPTRPERMKAAFDACRHGAAMRFACVYPAHDSESRETYPSFCIDAMFEEMFEGTLSATEALSGHANIDSPELTEAARRFLECGIVSLGEEDASCGVGQELSAPVRIEEVCRAERGVLHYLRLDDFMFDASTPAGILPAMSPSAMEAYLDCPYKWFIERMIRPEGLDEVLGPLERGSFAHEVFRAFYTRLKENYGTSRVSNVYSDDVVGLYAEVFEDVLRSQLDKAPNSGRYVPVTPSELDSANMLSANILESIGLLSMLPGSFDIAAQEFSLRCAEDLHECMDYAGFALVGKVDRIDSDPASGSFSVIDYKGSIASHDAGQACVDVVEGDGERRIDPDTLPKHIQVLVYAKGLLALGVFGKACAAALYTSYRANPHNPLVVGSYKGSDEGFAIISDPESAVDMPMEDFLDLVEDAVRKRLDPIRQSSIQIAPACKDACEYCKYSGCERAKAWD